MQFSYKKLQSHVEAILQTLREKMGPDVEIPQFSIRWASRSADDLDEVYHIEGMPLVRVTWGEEEEFPPIDIAPGYCHNWLNELLDEYAEGMEDWEGMEDLERRIDELVEQLIIAEEGEKNTRGSHGGFIV